MSGMKAMRNQSQTNAAVKRGAVRASMVVVGFALAATALMELSPVLFGIQVQKLPAPLQKPLSELPATLKGHTTYEAEGPDFAPTEEIKEQLGKAFLIREYVQKDETGKVLERFKVNLNFYDKGEATPHVPDVCWVGAGMVEKADEEVVIKGLRRGNGSTTDVPMRFISFATGSTSTPGITSPAVGGVNDPFYNVAYTFEVNGEFAGNRRSVVRKFWRADSKYGYHCKVEIQLDRVCPRAEAWPLIEEFMRAALPEIEGCLPDTKKLSNSEPVLTAQNNATIHAD